MASKADRYFVDQDSSCHWYLVPEKYRAKWEEWSSLDEEDEASWETPFYAKRLDGHPSQVTFVDPKGGGSDA